MVDKRGIKVYCATCARSKAPVGRSVPLGMFMCDFECDGYYEAPKPGALWPGELASEFGYPVSDFATEAVHTEEPSARTGSADPK
jgi:hypothetical protein